NRILVVFAPSENASLYQQQLAEIETMGDGFAERDLVLFSVFATEGQGPDATLSQAEVRFLRERYQVAPGEFVAILIGKDGGRKLRRKGNVLEEPDLFPLIDSMPMRQREMRQIKP
ncbi:MAG: DUF4174 domain-containing protein, partial [Bacteroidota bacterium]